MTPKKDQVSVYRQRGSYVIKTYWMFTGTYGMFTERYGDDTETIRAKRYQNGTNSSINKQYGPIRQQTLCKRGNYGTLTGGLRGSNGIRTALKYYFHHTSPYGENFDDFYGTHTSKLRGGQCEQGFT